MTHDAWNPTQYERFRDERSRPFFDLVALVQRQSDMSVVDLGCGTGELTAHLHRQLQAHETVGIDSSSSMLEKSGAFVTEGLRFQQQEIAEFARVGAASGARFDLVFSNAALHWLPKHEELLRQLTGLLRDRGQLAVQVPANFDHPSQSVAGEVAQESPYREGLHGHVRRKPVLDPEEYATLLDRLGYQEQHVRLQVYGHQLASREEVIEWVKGTFLTDYTRRLPADLSAQFLARYRERLLPLLDDARPYFYPFKRILFWGRK